MRENEVMFPEAQSCSGDLGWHKEGLTVLVLLSSSSGKGGRGVDKTSGTTLFQEELQGRREELAPRSLLLSLSEEHTGLQDRAIALVNAEHRTQA